MLSATDYLPSLALCSRNLLFVAEVVRDTDFQERSSRSSVSNYRPIALTSVACKTLGSIIAEQIMLHCEVNSLLDPQQFGFRSGRSTTLQLVDVLLDHWMSSLNSRRLEIDVVYIDFCAAFDVVNHRFLLRKLESFEICPSLISWIAAFVRDRTFSVRVGNSFSSWLPACSGVPQGSSISLSPLHPLHFV